MMDKNLEKSIHASRKRLDMLEKVVIILAEGLCHLVNQYETLEDVTDVNAIFTKKDIAILNHYLADDIEEL
jgi:hypothetical protein